MPRVERRSGESIEGLLKRFRRGLQESGQLRVYRRKRFFVSKSEAKRDKKRRAHRRLMRRERRLQRRELRRPRRR
jgi:small subunit ribosomal protein S21